MFAKRRSGWIGVDVGSGAIKIAQLRRVRDRLELSSAAALPLADRADGSLRDGISSARAMASSLRGDQVAAVLSMKTCRVEVDDEETEDDASLCRDAWDGGAGAYTFGAPTEQVENAVEEFDAVGLRCEVIDGLPLALARISLLAPDHEPGSLIGMLDWGDAAVTFVAAVGGQARYVRKLSAAGFAEVRRNIADALALTPAETDEALRRYGVAGRDASAEEKLLSDAILQAARPTIQEVRRTLAHLGAKLKTKGPDRLFVTGAGSAVAGLAEAVGDRLELSAEPWRAAGLERADDVAPPDCLLAPAIALSALGWEIAS